MAIRALREVTNVLAGAVSLSEAAAHRRPVPSFNNDSFIVRPTGICRRVLAPHTALSVFSCFEI
jgi:hypothetical protein